MSARRTRRAATFHTQPSHARLEGPLSSLCAGCHALEAPVPYPHHAHSAGCLHPPDTVQHGSLPAHRAEVQRKYLYVEQTVGVAEHADYLADDSADRGTNPPCLLPDAAQNVIRNVPQQVCQPLCQQVPVVTEVPVLAKKAVPMVSHKGKFGRRLQGVRRRNRNRNRNPAFHAGQCTLVYAVDDPSRVLARLCSCWARARRSTARSLYIPSSRCTTRPCATRSAQPITSRCSTPSATTCWSPACGASAASFRCVL